MTEPGYAHCPECDRRYMIHVKDNSKTQEEVCNDCASFPGWRKDFDSPPTMAQWREFKKTGEKVRSNPPRG